MTKDRTTSGDMPPDTYEQEDQSRSDFDDLWIEDTHDQSEDLERLRKVAALLEDTTEIMAQGILVHDTKTILFANCRAYELLEIPSELLQPERPWRDHLVCRIRRAHTAVDDFSFDGGLPNGRSGGGIIGASGHQFGSFLGF